MVVVVVLVGAWLMGWGRKKRRWEGVYMGALRCIMRWAWVTGLGNGSGQWAARHFRRYSSGHDSAFGNTVDPSGVR